MSLLLSRTMFIFWCHFHIIPGDSTAGKGNICQSKAEASGHWVQRDRDSRPSLDQWRCRKTGQVLLHRRLRWHGWTNLLWQPWWGRWGVGWRWGWWVLIIFNVVNMLFHNKCKYKYRLCRKYDGDDVHREFSLASATSVGEVPINWAWRSCWWCCCCCLMMTMMMVVEASLHFGTTFPSPTNLSGYFRLKEKRCLSLRIVCWSDTLSGGDCMSNTPSNQRERQHVASTTIYLGLVYDKISNVFCFTLVV